MGGADCYCCFCGAQAGEVFPHGEEDDVISQSGENLEWLSSLRIIGSNPEVRGLKKAFVTGPARHEDHGMYEAEMSDHPNCPRTGVNTTFEFMPNNGNLWITVYDQERSYPPASVYHAQCLSLFESMVRVRRGEACDLDLLWKALSDLVGSNYYSPHMDWGDIEDTHEQYWFVPPGYGLYVANPLKPPAEVLDRLQYLRQEPDRDASAQSHRFEESRTASVPKGDIFSQLPVEVVLHVTSYLPWNSIWTFRAASPSVLNLELTHGWWTQRVHEEKEWLLEIQDLAVEQEQRIDWPATWKLLNSLTDRQSKNYSLSVSNRQRIWGLCDQIFQVYEQKQREEDEFENQQGASLGPLETSMSLKTAWPEQNRGSRQSRIFALADWNGVKQTGTVLSFHWNEAGFLAGISFPHGSSIKKHETESYRTEKINLQATFWPSAILLTIGSTNLSPGDEAGSRKAKVLYGVVGVTVRPVSGDAKSIGALAGPKKILTRPADRAFCGFQCQSADGMITRLSMLTCDPFVSGDAASLDLTHGQVYDNNGYLWASELPPIGTSPYLFPRGYWSYAFDEQTTEISYLGLEDNGPNPSPLSAIAMDIALGAFEVRYANGHVRSIGSRARAMQVMELDYTRGEFVAGIATRCQSLISEVRIYTSTGRVLAAGIGQDAQMPTERFQSSDEEVMVGLIAQWRDSGGQPALESLGLVKQRSRYRLPSVQTTAHDQGRFVWHNIPPPTYSIVPDSSVPSIAANASQTAWLDLSRPITSLQIVLSHPHIPGHGGTIMSLATRQADVDFDKQLVQVLGMTVTYDDASTAGFGVQEVRAQPQVAGARCLCGVELGRVEPWPSDPRDAHYHVSKHGFNVPATPTRLDVWHDDKDRLEGFSFAWRDSASNPTSIGRCKGDSNGSIDLHADTAEGGSRGLMIMLQASDRHVQIRETAVVGFQALGI